VSDIKLKITDRKGEDHEIDIPTDMGFNLMEIFKANELPVEGTCGGMALCSTCHCYILSDHKLKEASEDEEDMLDQAFFVESNSRLGCQIQLSEEHDGLHVKLAPTAG
jgi:2Fe-2S ferredoxin